MNARDVQQIVIFQFHVRSRTVHYTFHIHRKHFACQVLTLSVQHRTVCKCVAQQSVSLSKQFLHCVYVFTEFVNTRSVNRTDHFKFVRESVDNRVGSHHITVHYLERSKLVSIHCRYRELSSFLSHNSHAVLVCVGSKESRIFQQGRDAFVTLHLILHRSFHLAFHLNNSLVCRNYDNVTFLQADITISLSLQYIFIYVNVGHRVSVSCHPDVSQAAKVGYTSCAVQSMEHRCESRQGIGARHHHFTHHVHLNASCISQCHLYLVSFIRIYLAQFALQILPCIGYVQSVQRNHSQSRYGDATVRRDFLSYRVLACPPYVYDDFIPRSQSVILGSGNIHVRFERQVLVCEDISSEHLVFRLHRFDRPSVFIHCDKHVRIIHCRVVQHSQLHLVVSLYVGLLVTVEFPLSHPAVGAYPVRNAAAVAYLSRLIHFLQSQGLFLRHTLGSEFHHQLLLVFTLFHTVLNVLYHLRVSHARLGKNRKCSHH